jgi:DNA-binding FadR family transcriptional regulator
VREAVKALEALGILESRTGSGLRVRAFSLDPILDNLGYALLSDTNSVLELIAVRRHLEVGFIEEVARQATPHQLRVLRSIVDRMGARAARGEPFPEEDRFFHQALYGPADNALLLRLIDVFWVVISRLRAAAQLEPSPDLVDVWEDHRRIVESLERHDPAGARAAMQAHFATISKLKQRIHHRPAASTVPDGSAQSQG